MQTITLRVPEALKESLDEEADDHGVSRSEHIRDLLATRHEHETNTAEYEAEIERLQAQIDDLQRQLAEANSRIDAANEIVDYVEDQRSLEQRRVQASILTRGKWWLFGVPDGETD